MKHRFHIGDKVKIVECYSTHHHTKVGTYAGHELNYYSVNLGKKGGYAICNGVKTLKLIKCVKDTIIKRVRFNVNKTTKDTISIIVKYERR